MKISLTCLIGGENPACLWAKQSDNPHVAMGHEGTHIDTYLKKAIPSEYNVSRAVLFSCFDKEEITLDDVDLEAVQYSDFVLMHTGWIEKFSYGSREYFLEHPYCSDELIYALLDKKVRFIGIDCAGIKRHEEHEKFDRICEDRNVYVVENMVNLGRIILPARIEAIWQNDEGLTGLPCIIHAFCE